MLLQMLSGFIWESVMKEMLTRFRALVLFSSILIYALIVLGGIVRFTQSGGACPDWPTCMGMWTPPGETLLSPLMLDYLHRAGTLLAGTPVLLSAALAWIIFRRDYLALDSDKYLFLSGC